MHVFYINVLTYEVCKYHICSFILTDRIPKWWIWGYWWSPLMYAQNAASVNEFLGHSWDKVIISLLRLLIIPDAHSVFNDVELVSFSLFIV